MKGKREAENNFNFKSEKLDELRKRYPGVPHFAGKT